MHRLYSARCGLAAASILVFFGLAGSEALAGVTGVVRGVVTVAGKPTGAGATITITGEGNHQQTQANARGAFSFPNVPFGRYDVSAHVAGQPDAHAPIDVQTDGVVTVELHIGALQKIGQTQTSLIRGPANEPVGVTTLTRADINALPQSDSLNQIIETTPGIVRFSYNEPVAHGFHGLTYEIDGAPLPFATASNFAEIIDPRSIDSMDIITGPFPAEFGGYRQGSVVNIVSHRAADMSDPTHGTFQAGIGNYASSQAQLGSSINAGSGTRIFFNANAEQTGRALDSPTFDPIHDNGSQSNAFVRSVTNLSKQDTLDADVSFNYATFQIPINTSFNINDPVISPPGTDDVQLENDSFANVNYTHNTKDGTGYYQVIPWYRYDRIRYLGDLANDIAGTLDGVPNSLSGLQQDRRSSFYGLRTAAFHVWGDNAFKAGIEDSIENFNGNEQILYFNANGVLQPPFYDNSAQTGSLFSAYVQDKWTPTRYFTFFPGLRYDHSTGYVGGSQLEPRIEADAQVDPRDIVHGYFGIIYAAPFLEDTRRAAVVLYGEPPGALPVYDLQPEVDSYYEFGIAHTFGTASRGYINLWKRNARNVLDTTQLANTPIFAVFNNSIGIAQGVDTRFDQRWDDGSSLFVTATLSKALAGGISGSTFLFPPGTDTSDNTLSYEDHDQPFAATVGYTKKFGLDHSFFATLEPQYGMGYPVQFQTGSGRLPPHLTFDASVGRFPTSHQKSPLGFVAQFTNFTNTQYLIKVNNGFNTTQWGAGFQYSLRMIYAF